MVSVGSRFG
nr:unnamed protein product [Callosobruchus chinensis]